MALTAVAAAAVVVVVAEVETVLGARPRVPARASGELHALTLKIDTVKSLDSKVAESFYHLRPFTTILYGTQK